METWQAVLAGLIPSIAVGLLFWFVMRAIFRADRNERAALAQIDRDDAAAAAAASAPAQTQTADAPAAPSPAAPASS